MAKLNFGGDFTPFMPKPIGPLNIIEAPGIMMIQYAGFTVSLEGDFSYASGRDPTGIAYVISLNGPSGQFFARNTSISVPEILAAVRSLDLLKLVEEASSGADELSGYGPQFGGAGDDVFENASKGPLFGGQGTDTFVSSQPSSQATISLTERGTLLKANFGDEILLIGIEKIKFSDKTVDISPAAPLYDYAAAARAAILREAPNDFLSYADGKAGTNPAIATALMTKAEDSTLPAVIAYQEIMGKTPGSAQLDSLAAFVKGQINSTGYQATANPRLGGYEAMGLGLSGTPEFAAKFGAGTEAVMVSAEYQHLFGRAATSAQVTHFVGQIDYFKSLYVGAGISEADAAIKARGAVVGQMLGYAAGEKADIHDAAVAFLMKAADGTAAYGSPLEMI